MKIDTDWAYAESRDAGYMVTKIVNRPEFQVENILKNKTGERESEMVKGVYFLIFNNEIVYIGISNNVFERIRCHSFRKKIRFTHYSFVPVNTSKKMLERIESQCIIQFCPAYNKKIKFPCDHRKAFSGPPDKALELATEANFLRQEANKRLEEYKETTYQLAKIEYQKSKIYERREKAKEKLNEKKEKQYA